MSSAKNCNPSGAAYQQRYHDKMSPPYNEEDIGDSLINDNSPFRQRLPWYRRTVRGWGLHHIIGGAFICLGLLVIVFAKPLFSSPPAFPPVADHLEKRVDKGTVRLAMLGTGAMGLSGIGSAFSSSSVGQGIFNGLVTLFSGIILYTSDTSRISEFFGYPTKRDVEEEKGLMSINGVFPQETNAWNYLHTVKDTKLDWHHHGRNVGGWVRFNSDDTTSWGTKVNYTLPSSDIEKRESGGCEVLGTCPQAQADIILNTNPGDSGGIGDEEWDSDDWNQLATSWVSQLQSAMADTGNFEIDNPAGVAISGTFEVDQS